MGKVKKGTDTISVAAPAKEFLDMEVPVYGKIEGKLPRLGYFIALAAKKKLEDLNQVPFHLSQVSIGIENNNLIVTFKLKE